ALERFDDKPPVGLGHLFRLDLGLLNFDHSPETLLVVTSRRRRTPGPHHPARPSRSRHGLPGVVLDDEVLLHAHVDLLARGQALHGPFQAVRIQLEPIRHAPALSRLDALLDHRDVPAALPDGDDVAHLHPRRRDIHLLPVHREVTVHHQLPGRSARRREAQPVDHVVQPALQELQEGFARHALAAGRLLVITPKLALQHPVDPAQLLLLTQVDAVFSQTRAPSLAVLARRIRAAVHGALLSIALFTLQKELFSLTPAQPANGSSIPCHRSVFHLRRLRSDPPPLGRTATVVRNRGDVFDQVHFETGSLERTDSRLP